MAFDLLRFTFLLVLLPLTLSFLPFSRCWAVTYYVDAQYGDDSGSGTSAEHAWKTLSKVNRTNLKPGDIVRMKRGEKWREPLQIPNSGTPDNPIVFCDYGEGGKPVVSGGHIMGDWTHAGGSLYYTKVTTRPYRVVEDSRFLKEVNSIADLAAGCWFYETSTSNLYIHTPESDSPESHVIEAAQNDMVISLQTRSHIILKNIIAELCNSDRAGIYMYDSGTNVSILNCVSRFNRREGIGVTGISGKALVTIDSCVTHHNGSAGIDITSGSNLNRIEDLSIINNVSYNNMRSYYYRTGKIDGYGIKAFYTDNSYFAHNVCYANEHNGLHLDGESYVAGGCSYNIVEYNVCYGNHYSGLEIEAGSNHNHIRFNYLHENAVSGAFCGAISISSQSNNNYIYYNVAKHGSPCAVIWVNLSSAGNHFYNNVLIPTSDQTRGFYFGGEGSQMAVGTEIKNNIYYGRGTARAMYLVSEEFDGFQSDNNCWYNCAGNIIAYNNNWSWSYNDYRENTRNDLNSIISDPILTNAVNDDFEPSGDSPVINGGTPVDLPVESDLRGVSLFQGAAPDIGAFEISSETPAINVLARHFIFGDTCVGRIKSGAFVIRNTGSTNLALSHIRSDNALFSVSPSEATVGPGEEQMVALTFSPNAPESCSAAITLDSNSGGKDTTSKVIVSGTGRSCSLKAPTGLRIIE